MQKREEKVKSLNKQKTFAEAVAQIRDGSVIMIGGFMGAGCPHQLIDAVVASGAQNLTVISNDTTFEGQGVGKLIASGQATKVIATHIGLNPQAGRYMNEGKIQVELVPQGTLVERIRSGGAGLGGFLTPTGLGTIVEEGKERIVVDGKAYLLETALKADVALLKAHKADTLGNLVFRRAARNFNPIMATAAEYVIAEVEETVKVGDIDPDHVMLPGLFVDTIVKGGAEIDG